MTAQDSDAESHKTSDLLSTRSTSSRPLPEVFNPQANPDSDTESVATQMPLHSRNTTGGEQQGQAEPAAAEDRQENDAVELETRISEMQTQIQNHQTQLDGLSARVDEQEVAFARHQKPSRPQLTGGIAIAKAKGVKKDSGTGGKEKGSWKPKSRRERILFSYLRHF